MVFWFLCGADEMNNGVAFSGICVRDDVRRLLYSDLPLLFLVQAAEVCATEVCSFVEPLETYRYEVSCGSCRTSSLLNTIIMYTVSTGLVTRFVIAKTTACYILTSLSAAWYRSVILLRYASRLPFPNYPLRSC